MLICLVNICLIIQFSVRKMVSITGQILIILFLVMDPRPYNYQYRRPRLDNQTYQSYNAYQSLFHAGKMQSQYHNPNMRDEHAYLMNLYNPNYPNIYSSTRNNQNMSINEEPVRRYQDKSINTDKYSEKSHHAKSTYSERSKSSASSKPDRQNNQSSILSNYGSNSLEKNRQSLAGEILGNETSTIYKKQQRPFDIINFRARQSSPLKKFPKLTLEHLLQERGVINMD